MTSVVVTAAVVERDGRLLVTRRLKGTHLEDHWEFPGGKCDPGETLQECLVRELWEELAVDAIIGDEILSTTHVYEEREASAERRVELHFFYTTLLGDPQPQLGQDMQWIRREDLRTLKLPPADDELVALLMRDER